MGHPQVEVSIFGAKRISPSSVPFGADHMVCFMVSAAESTLPYIVVATLPLYCIAFQDEILERPFYGVVYGRVGQRLHSDPTGNFCPRRQVRSSHRRWFSSAFAATVSLLTFLCGWFQSLHVDNGGQDRRKEGRRRCPSHTPRLGFS